MKQQDSFWVWSGAAGAALAAVALGVYYYYSRERTPEPAETPAAVSAPPATAPSESPPIAVVDEPTATPDIPLPALDESDADVQGGLTEIFGPQTIEQFLVPQRIIRNVVVTIDNLPREKTAIQQRPIKSTPGELIVGGTDEAPVLATENYARYTPFVTAVGTVDAKTIVAFYRGLQPLFQQSYEELGNPNSLFNTRLLEVIEHLLATPDVRGPIRLTQPGVFYRYADKNLEELSAGQKLLIRMGPDNAAIVKEKLREIQSELL
jgi:Protein of unknown function (DUF3014)